MIRLHISGKGYDITDKIRAYVNNKIGALDKYLPAHTKDAAGAVILSLDPSGREDNQCVCEVEIQLPGSAVQAKEATINMFAAVDIVEAKIKAQIIKYKQKNSPKQSRRQIFLAKLMRRHT